MSSKRAIHRRERRNSCGAKQAHPSQTHAVAHMIHLRRDDIHLGRDGGDNLTTYLCVFCGFWHVGHRKRNWKGY